MSLASALIITLEEQLLKYYEGKDYKVLDPYYAHKIKTHSMIDAYDITISQYILAIYPISTKILEVGAGYGQLSLLLSLQGYETYPIDMAQSRHDVSNYLVTALSLQDSCHPIKCSYPDNYSGSPFDLLIATNVINSFWQEKERNWNTILQYKDAIIDVERWGLHRPNHMDQQQIISQICKEGYTAQCINERELYAFHKKD